MNNTVTTTKTKSFWRGFGLAFAFLGVFFAAQIIPSIIAGIYIGISQASQIMQNGTNAQISGSDIFSIAGDMANSIPNYGIIMMIAQFAGWILIILAIPLLYKLIKVNGIKQPMIPSLELGKIKPAAIGLSVVAGLAMAAFTPSALALIPVPEAMFEQMENVFSFTDSTPRWMLLLGIGIIGPIAEELALRSGVFSVMRRDSSFWVAALVSSLLFGLMHGIPLQICYATVIGLILAVICHLTKSVWPCAIIHIINNSWSFVMPESAANSVDSFLFGGSQAVTLITFIVSAALLVGSVYAMARVQKNSAWQVSYQPA